MKDAMLHAQKKIPGLYEAGLSVSSTARLFQAPRKCTTNARAYHAVVAARVPHKRNNGSGELAKGTHEARSEQKLFKEFQMPHGQPCVSGDDMNIIQVGRAAVSRYHQINRLFGCGAGPNHEIHDFLLPELGIKSARRVHDPVVMCAGKQQTA